MGTFGYICVTFTDLSWKGVNLPSGGLGTPKCTGWKRVNKLISGSILQSLISFMRHIKTIDLCNGPANSDSDETRSL